MESLSVVTSVSMLINQMILIPNTKMFMDILSQANLVQHINEPTNKLGNTLDLIIHYKKKHLFCLIIKWISKSLITITYYFR